MSDDPVLDALRELARHAVKNSSLRLVAREVGISHPALAEFVAKGSTRSPYGPSRRRLIDWAQGRGAKLPAELRVVREPQRAWGAEMIPPDAYNAIFARCRELKAARVPDSTIEEARRLMLGELTPILRFGSKRRSSEVEWKAFTDQAWEIVKTELLRDGYKL